MFELAQKLRHDNSEWEPSFEILRSAECYWDMPHTLFMTWIDHYVRPNSRRDTDYWGGVSCRVIKDKNNIFHFLPCWSSYVRLISRSVNQGATGSESTEDLLQPNSKPISLVSASVFGNPYLNRRCIFSFVVFSFDAPGLRSADDSKVPLSEALVVGWDSPLPQSLLSNLSVEKRFLEAPYEVRPSYSFLSPANTSSDNERRTNNSIWASSNSPRWFSKFDDVRKEYNSMWRIWT